MLAHSLMSFAGTLAGGPSIDCFQSRAKIHCNIAICAASCLTICSDRMNGPALSVILGLQYQALCFPAATYQRLMSYELKQNTDSPPPNIFVHQPSDQPSQQTNQQISRSVIQSSNDLVSQMSFLLNRECRALVEELDLPVEYILLSTFAYEHKIFVAPFNRAFPDARVWTAPG